MVMFRAKTVLKIGLVLLLVLMLVSTSFGCAPKQPIPTPSPPPSPASPSAPPPPPAPRPDLRASAIIPQQSVTFGQIFDLILVINNYGNGPALNTSLYARANPAGYLQVLSSSPPASPLAPAGLRFSLGDIYPNARTEVRMQLRAPTQAQIGGLPGMNIETRFTYDYYYAGAQQSETLAGTLVFSVSESGGPTMFFVPQ